MKKTWINLSTCLRQGFGRQDCLPGKQERQTIITSIFTLLMAVPVLAQLELPRPSPKASVMQTVGITAITIEYCAPRVRGRVIWDSLVPYNEPWRTGANAPVKITFSNDVIIKGNDVAAGEYVLFTIPAESEWTVRINKKLMQWWDPDSLKEEDDVLNIKVKPQKTEAHQEAMNFSFSNLTDNTVDIDLKWKKLKLSFKIETDLEKQIEENIKSAVANAKDDDWRLYARIADYYENEDKELDKAMKMIDKSISIKETTWNHWVKADLLAKKKKYKNAIKYAKKTIEIGNIDGKEYRYKSRLEKKIAEWESKM